MHPAMVQALENNFNIKATKPETKEKEPDRNELFQTIYSAIVKAQPDPNELIIILSEIKAELQELNQTIKNVWG